MSPSMRRSDLVELVALAALWGGSFLFMRLGAGEFGPVALVALRVAGAAALLLPLVVWRGQAGALRRHWRAILVVGLLNSALPFLGLAGTKQLPGTLGGVLWSFIRGWKHDSSWCIFQLWYGFGLVDSIDWMNLCIL